MALRCVQWLSLAGKTLFSFELRYSGRLLAAVCALLSFASVSVRSQLLMKPSEPGEQITLISYAPFSHPSVWTEVGPVYIHASRCQGYQAAGRLPGQLATGPRVLRTYRADDTMNYDHNTVITDDTDLAPVIQRLLGEPDVATVHVRTLAPQCFLYAVTAQNGHQV